MIAGGVASTAAAGGQAGFRLRYLLPAPELRAYVSAYNFFEAHPAPGAPFTELFWPRWANLHLTLAGTWSARIETHVADPVPPAALFGVTSHPTRIRADQMVRAVGAGLTPLGWSRLFSRPATDFTDRIVDLGEVVGPAAEQCLAELAASHEDAWSGVLDAFFRERLAAAGEIPADVTGVHRLLIDTETRTVEEIAAELGLSTRHVTRLCGRIFGLTPKLLLRRTRFLRTLVGLAPTGGRAIAARLGEAYHDQSHFIRDCRRFLGMTPGAFFAHPHPLLEASMQLRTRVVGTPLQALHQPSPERNRRSRGVRPQSDDPSPGS